MSRPHTNEPGWPDFVSRYGVGDVADGEVVSVVALAHLIASWAGEAWVGRRR